MKKLLLLLCLAGLTTPLVVAAPAWAADDLDEDDSRSRRSRGSKKQVQAREVVHGMYIKATFGSLGWLGALGAESSFGTSASFEFGYDVVDQLPFTLSISGTYYQGINNGISVDDGGSGITQGDFRSIGGLVGARLGFNPGKRKVRRWTIAVDIKGGIYVSPALREKGQYDSGALQASPGALILPGFGIEHFSRLSHFSLGADVHVPLVVGTPAGFVPGLDIVGFFKYTF